jgi:hypothetical protein
LTFADPRRGFGESPVCHSAPLTAHAPREGIAGLRKLVIELVNKMPEDAPLAEIAREIELLAGIHTAGDQARRGERYSR